MGWSRKGRYLVSAGDDGTLRVWEVASGDCVAVYVATPSGGVAFRPGDGRYRVQGSGEGGVWHMIGLARYELGELDAFVPGGLRLRDDEPLFDLRDE